MYTKDVSLIEKKSLIVIPQLPEEVILRLPKYFKPNKNNLATQYYFWNRELIKENSELKKVQDRLEHKLTNAEEKISELESEKEKLKSERDKFREMLFKFEKRKPVRIKHKPQLRTKESYTRKTPETIDRYKTATFTQCPHCEGYLSKQIDSYQRIVEDIPNYEILKAKTTEYTISRYYCKHCKKIVTAKPKDVLPKSRLGINTLLYVLHSKYRLRLSHDLIRENLATQFNLAVAYGEITNLLRKGSLAFGKKWQEIVETIKTSKTVNADETSWQIGKDKAWLWTFVTDKAVRYTIAESRGKGVAQEILGEDYEGIVGADFYSSYSQFRNKQRCWVHLLRHARELCQDKATKERQTIKNKLSRIYQDILLFRLKENATDDEKTIKAQEIKNQLENLAIICRIKSGFANDKNLSKLLKLCKRFSGELVTCVLDFSVLPENNIAERAIRPAVLMRKISGGSRSLKGAKIHETNLSVMETLVRESLAYRQTGKKQDIFPAMKKLVLESIASDE